MRAFCTVLIAGAIIGSALRACAETELINGVQAVVHDAVVTVGEVRGMSFQAEQLLLRQYSARPEALMQKVEEVRDEDLKQLIERQLILHDFKVTFGQPDRQAFIDKEINKEVDQELEAEIRVRTGGNRMTFIKTLQEEGITLERHRQIIRDRIIVGWLRQKNISSELIVSPHRVEVYYLAHRDEFKVQDEVKLRMIVLKCPGASEAAKTEKLLADILTAIREGATFAEMATIHSEGSQRNQGGDLGWWEPSRLNKSLADTAVSLQAGQVSGVLSRSMGDDYWVCQYQQ